MAETVKGRGRLAIEFELKFRCPEQAVEQLRQAVPGQERLYAMQTTYYDTPERALSDRYYTLRLRQKNDLRICTLKCPAEDGGRGEFELECDSIQQAIPELCKLSGVAELVPLTAGGVVPVCGARFQRVAKIFTWQDTTMELALDRGILTGGGREVALCEAELELKQGSREVVRAYAALLTAAYGLVPEKDSKFRRALALAKGE